MSLTSLRPTDDCRRNRKRRLQFDLLPTTSKSAFMPKADILRKQKWVGDSKLYEATRGGIPMPDSIYNVIELVGTSTESWEKAAKAAVETAAKSLRDLRIAEIEKLDAHIKDGKVETYRAKVKISFKYEGKG